MRKVGVQRSVRDIIRDGDLDIVVAVVRAGSKETRITARDVKEILERHQVMKS